jgi:NAD(P)H-dependent flavin oxidoreductase YrpB (nitropropane dioxygenase family)
MGKRVLRTKLCDMLGIEYPILSAGMGPTLIGEKTGAPVELVVAVSDAGGLGVLGVSLMVSICFCPSTWILKAASVEQMPQNCL